MKKEKKMKILINADCSVESIGAQDRDGKHYAIFLDSNKYDISIFCKGRPDKRVENNPNIKIINLSKNKYVEFLEKLFHSLFRRFDVILNGKATRYEKLYLQFKRVLRVKTKIITFVVNLVPYGVIDSKDNKLSDFILFKSDYLVAISKRIAETVKKYKCIDIPIIYYLCDLNLFKEIAPHNQRKKIICVASMIAVKQPFLFANIAKETPEADFIWIGERYYFNDMKRKIKEDEIGNLELPGTIKNNLLPEYLAKADIFLYPSIHDGFPSVIVEAMGCGLPVIAFDRYGPEAVIDNKTGYVVKSEFEMLKKLKYLLSHEDILRKFSINARERALDFEGSKAVKELESFIDKIIKKNVKERR